MNSTSDGSVEGGIKLNAVGFCGKEDDTADAAEAEEPPEGATKASVVPVVMSKKHKNAVKLLLTFQYMIKCLIARNKS
jgi:hypothetical protein